MPFCAVCGSQVDGAFCAKCGTPVGAAPLPPATSGPASGEIAPNLAAALCYSLGLLTGILFLVLAPYNKSREIRFHAFQSIFMHVACIVVYIVLTTVFSVMHLWGLGSLVWLACIGLWLYLLITAYQGKTVVLPVIGPIAQQQAGN